VIIQTRSEKDRILHNRMLRHFIPRKNNITDYIAKKIQLAIAIREKEFSKKH